MSDAQQGLAPDWTDASNCSGSHRPNLSNRGWGNLLSRLDEHVHLVNLGVEVFDEFMQEARDMGMPFKEVQRWRETLTATLAKLDRAKVDRAISGQEEEKPE